MRSTTNKRYHLLDGRLAVYQPGEGPSLKPVRDVVWDGIDNGRPYVHREFLDKAHQGRTAYLVVNIPGHTYASGAHDRSYAEARVLLIRVHGYDPDYSGCRVWRHRGRGEVLVDVKGTDCRRARAVLVEAAKRAADGFHPYESPEELVRTLVGMNDLAKYSYVN